MPAPDQSADVFAAYLAARGQALARTAYLLTGDHHLAEDLVQNALIKAAAAWHRIQGDPEPYVRRILYTEHVSSWRRTRRHLREVPVATLPDRATEPADPDLRLALQQALSLLTPKQRTVLVLRYVEDLTEVQTARALGLGVGTVKSNTRDALARLRALAPDLAELVAR